MNTQNYHSYLLSLFSEMNGHIRNTENKYLTISLSYLSLVAIISSVILNEMILTAININYIVVYVLIILVGICVIILQQWYRLWKKHYLYKCQEIDNKIIEIQENQDDCYFAVEYSKDLKPCWLNNEYRKTKNKIQSIFGADNTLQLLTNWVNFGVVLKLAYDLFLLLSKYNFVEFIFIVPIGIIFAYILFILIILNAIYKEFNFNKAD